MCWLETPERVIEVTSWLRLECDKAGALRSESAGLQFCDEIFFPEQRRMEKMKSELWRRQNHVQFLTRLMLLALHFATAIQPVQGASNQLPLSGVITAYTPSSNLVSSNGIFALGFFPSSTGAGFRFGIWYAQLTSLGFHTVVWTMPLQDLRLSRGTALELSPGGVLQLIDNSTVVWTPGNHIIGKVLELQDDGNLVLLDATLSNSVIWQRVVDTPTDTLLPGQGLRVTTNHYVMRARLWYTDMEPLCDEAWSLPGVRFHSFPRVLNSPRDQGYAEKSIFVDVVLGITIGVAVVILIGYILLVFSRRTEFQEYFPLFTDVKNIKRDPTESLDYYRLAIDSIKAVQNIVKRASERPLQLNDGQCKILAQELANVGVYLLATTDEFMANQNGMIALHHLYYAIRKAELLIEQCCCKTSESWLVTAMTLVEIQEYFAAIILDLNQWRMILDNSTITSAGGASRHKQEELLMIMDEKYQELYKNLHRSSHDLQQAALEDKRKIVLKLAEFQESENSLECLRAIHLQTWLAQLEDGAPLVGLNVQQKLTKFKDPEVLGRGGCGTVLRVTWLGVHCALKVLNVKDEREATALKGLLHPNIIRLYHYWEAPSHNPKSHLLMELMAIDLTVYIESRLKDMVSSSASENEDTMPFSLPVAIDIMLQVAQAMQYLHDKHLTHRDLKTSNILVSEVSEDFTNFESAEGYLDIKLADFGLAKAYSNTSTGNGHTINTGTPVYGAPEIFGKDLAAERSFPPMADVWSFGVTCAEILSGKKPYANELRNTLQTRIAKENLRPTLPKLCPPFLAFCIRSCWEYQPQRRPDFGSICKMLRHAKLLSLNLTKLDDSKQFLAYTTRSGFVKRFRISS